MQESLREQRRVVEGLGAVEAKAEIAGGFGEGDVDVVEDLDMVAEEADGLEDDSGMAFVADGGKRVLDGGTDPRAAGEVPSTKGTLGG